MVVCEEINQDDFKFCPKCGAPVKFERIVRSGRSATKETDPYLVCTGNPFTHRYGLGLAVDYG
jgi:hypothetical protein